MEEHPPKGPQSIFWIGGGVGNIPKILYAVFMSIDKIVETSKELTSSVLFLFLWVSGTARL